MEYIFNLEIVDFIELLETLDSNIKEEFGNKQDELLLHKWGYELIFMDEYMTLGEYIDLSKSKPKIEISDEDNIELIEKIEKIRIKHQEKVGEINRTI